MRPEPKGSGYLFVAHEEATATATARQRQKQKQKQIPCGDDRKKGNRKGKEALARLNARYPTPPLFKRRGWGTRCVVILGNAGVHRFAARQLRNDDSPLRVKR